MMFTNYYGQTKEQYDLCYDKIERSNQSAILQLSSCSLAITGVLAVLSMFNQRSEGLFFTYMTYILLLVLFVLLRKYVSFFRHNIMLQCYCLLTILIVLSIMISLNDPEQKGTVFPVVIVLTPLMFIDRPIRMTVDLLVMTLIYCVLVVKYKVPIKAYYDVADACVFFSVSVLAHYYFNTKVLKSIVNEYNLEQLIHKYKYTQDELEQRIQKDPMTGLFHREAFIKQVEAKIVRTQFWKQTIILGILDVDHFKQINDRYGHQVGDEIIRKASNVLRMTLRRQDIVGRLGGDEYIFLLNDIDDIQVVKRILKRMVAAMNQIKSPEHLTIGVSIGVTIVEHKVSGFKELYKRADLALYKAKELGRNQYCIYEEKVEKK